MEEYQRVKTKVSTMLAVKMVLPSLLETSESSKQADQANVHMCKTEFESQKIILPPRLKTEMEGFLEGFAHDDDEDGSSGDAKSPA